MPIIIQQDRDEHIQNRQGDGLWGKASDNDIDIVQRQDFNDYK